MRKLIILTAAALALTACSGDKAAKTEKASSVGTVQETSNVIVKGALSYRERIALRPGLTAKVTLSDVSVADRAAPLLAEQEFELRGLQVPIPFELSVDSEQLKSGGRYAIRGVLFDPEETKLWTTDTVYLIDPALAEQDLGALNIVRTEARRSTLVSFYRCGTTEVETRVSDDEMTIVIDGEETILSKVMSASGEKYEAGEGEYKSVFWEKGDFAQLNIGTEAFPKCTIEDLK